MANNMYVKTDWKDHIVNPESGEVIQQGTRFTANRANNMEEGIHKAHENIILHEESKENPHAVTARQVGLGSVNNYGLATQAEAEAGASNVKYMTPQRTKEALLKLIIAKAVPVADIENYFDGTDTEEVLQEVGKLLTEHLSDEVIHNIPHRTIRLNRDANNIFTTIEHHRKSDNTLLKKAVLSGGTSPTYTTRTVTYYAKDGTTVIRTDVYTLSYDADGNFVSEV